MHHDDPHKGKAIHPDPFQGPMALDAFVDRFFTAYNGARLREACQLLEREILRPDVLVGWSLSGAMTPAGFGGSFLVPLIEAGFVDYLVSTGANLYHDIHFGVGFDLHQSSPFADDLELRRRNLIRIYDIVFDYDVLAKTDNFLYHLIEKPQFQKKMGTAELHFKLGEELEQLRQRLDVRFDTVLGAGMRCGVPVFCASPGDSTIGLNVAAKSILGCKLEMDVSLDVNESTALVYDASVRGMKSAVVIIGGGAPKNFLLQTEPQIQEIFGLMANGHDYFVQITDARPDTGGLSGATPGEAVSWGKVDPAMLSNTVVAYLDASIGLPILAAYALSRCERRPLNLLYDRREEMVQTLSDAYREVRHRLQGIPIERASAEIGPDGSTSRIQEDTDLRTWKSPSKSGSHPHGS